jgi:hypothetical protein
LAQELMHLIRSFLRWKSRLRLSTLHWKDAPSWRKMYLRRLRASLTFVKDAKKINMLFCWWWGIYPSTKRSVGALKTQWEKLPGQAQKAEEQDMRA